ncbi:MAG: hypothetical protein FWC80_00195 [Firmicutes bacterium]|nr:hypothetical protein [Bacillota bacterium]
MLFIILQRRQNSRVELAFLPPLRLKYSILFMNCQGQAASKLTVAQRWSFFAGSKI